ncbi:zinc ABC transporter substrate-binding protein [Alphaproteobacteria bacterium]|nr:zinc ABC transporter substrate-binding protein [Alphaproteobacteria bacterium]
MNLFQKSIFFGLAPLFLSFSAKADIKVVTTIKPLHSLVSSVMDGVSEPSLIIEGTNNPHTFVFKPSHAKLLEEADMVFWIGEDLEAFMEKPLDSLASNAKKIAFMDLASIEKLKFREENIFDDHDDHDGHKDDDHDDHDDHDGHDDEHEGHDDHDDHDGHKDDDHDDHDDHDGHDDEHEGHDDHDDHDGHKDDDHDDHDDHDGHDDEHEGHDDHAGHEGHNHGEFDAHIWLDPMNAKEMVHEIAHELSELDPSNKEIYEANANKTLKSLDKLIEDVDKAVPKDISYIVFHDAYQYFEKRFGVSSVGALTLNSDVLPGAKQIADVQDLISDKGIKCIFSEPQYNPKIIETLASDMNISTGIMDPLGAYLEKGNTMYFDLIKQISSSIDKCN